MGVTMIRFKKIMISLMSFGACISFSGCGSQSPMSEFERTTRNIYETGLREGAIQDQTYEQWLESIRGTDGHTPSISIGDNGHWFIDDVDTGVSAQGNSGKDGQDGTSLLTGNSVPLTDQGRDGDSYIDLLTWNYYLKDDGVWALKGNLKGENGLSAYELYVSYHPEYKDSEEQWLDDLINGRLGNKEVHTVTFDSDGGSPVDTQTVLHGEKAIRPEAPTRDGYIFSDWVDEYNDHWVFNGFSITSDITLKAVWSEIYPYSKIKINEICSKNRFSFVDKYGEDSDWVELYNSSNTPLNLNGCGLSDDSEKPYLLTFDNVIIEPDSYLVIALSGRTNKLYEEEYHAPFTLSQKKEGKILFSAPYGVVDSITYPALKDDISYGRLGDELSMLKPSAGHNNEEAYIEKQILSAPTFSKSSGLYDEEFDLTLTSEQGYHIYYTIDSGTPNELSNRYDSPIHVYDKSSEPNVLSARTDISGSYTPYSPTSPVSKCMVVRAICYDDYGNYSPVVSSSYWIGQNDFIHSDVSITSVNTDFDNLFGSEKGIYCRGKIWDDWVESEEYDPSMFYSSQPANYQQKGFEWEREGNITFLNNKQKLKCEQSIGIRIKGSSTRGQPKKSFNLYSRYLYDGNNKFDYKFNDKKCEKITLRAGGNNYNYMITDPINSMLAKKVNLDIETQDTQPTYLYLNGEFWGIYFITDAFDSRYIEEKYDIEDSMIWKAGEIEEGYKTDIDYFNDARNTIGKSLLTEEGFDAFSNNYSISSFIDNLIFHSYIDHFDYNLFSSNSSCWRSRIYDESNEMSDQKIRFMLYDTDFSLGTHFDYTHYPQLFSQIEASSTLKYLFESNDFLLLLKERANSFTALLSSDETINYIEEYYDFVEPLIKQSNIRYYGIEDVGQQTRYDTMIDFLQNRADYYNSFISEL